jgi:hypothetical protein
VSEEPLDGGRNASEVVRVGDTVRRAKDPGSACAAALLGYLESAGYRYAPRYLGVDDRGRDILTYIPGRTTDHPSQRADGAYAQGAAMLRELHDLTAGHPHASGSRAPVSAQGRRRTTSWFEHFSSAAWKTRPARPSQNPSVETKGSPGDRR